jgi:hypothetical protein
VQGSLARSVGAWESWVRPLADGSFAAVLLNKVRKIIITFFEPFLYGKRAFVKTGSGQPQEKLRKRGCFLGVLLDKGADPVNVTLTVAASGAFPTKHASLSSSFGGGSLVSCSEKRS